MQEDKHLTELLKRGATAEASPELEIAIMHRVHKIAEARKQAKAPLLNLRLLIRLVVAYTLLSVLALLMSFMLDKGYSFESKAISTLFTLDTAAATTLVVSLLAFWALILFNFMLKKYLKKAGQK